jgi:hypothetical protein
MGIHTGAHECHKRAAEGRNMPWEEDWYLRGYLKEKRLEALNNKVAQAIMGHEDNYTTDLLAAWQVLEKVVSDKVRGALFCWSDDPHDQERYSCDFWSEEDGRESEAWANIASLAICLAALDFVVGSESKKMAARTWSDLDYRVQPLECCID